jgi:hypothetical protein
LSEELGMQKENPGTFSIQTANTVLKLNRLLEQTLIRSLLLAKRLSAPIVIRTEKKLSVSCRFASVPIDNIAVTAKH